MEKLWNRTRHFSPRTAGEQAAHVMMLHPPEHVSAGAIGTVMFFYLPAVQSEINADALIIFSTQTSFKFL